MVAAGLAGPARVSVGSVRDFVLGATMINGRGEVLTFGGQVMKNVAGYDVARLLAGSLGILGLICEVSLKVLPRPVAQCTVRVEADEAAAIATLQQLGGQPLPLNASAWWDGMLVLRLPARPPPSSRHASARRRGHRAGPGGCILARAARPQRRVLRRCRRGGGARRRPVAPVGAADPPPLKLPGEQLIEWGGAQRWLCSAAPAAHRARGGGARSAATPCCSVAQRQAAGDLRRRCRRRSSASIADLKQAFDPDGIFNPGRLYPGL